MKRNSLTGLALTGCLLISMLSFSLTPHLQTFHSENDSDVINNLSTKQTSALKELSSKDNVGGKSNDSPGVLWEWAAQAGGDYGSIVGSMRSDGIALDSSGSAYVTGFMSGLVVFNDNITLGEYQTTPTKSEIFIAKLSSDGSWQWAIKVDGNGTGWGHGITVDSNNDIFVTGRLYDSATFGNTNLTNDDCECSSIFVAKLSSSGSWQWAVKVGGSYSSAANGITVDSRDGVYITGWNNGRLMFGTFNLSSEMDGGFIAKISSSGIWEWAVEISGTYTITGSRITADLNDGVYITGGFTGSASFGDTVLSSSADSEVFIAKLNSSGSWQWAVKSEGSIDATGLGIAVDSIGSLYVTGRFKETVTFGNTNLTSSGDNDVFIAKLSSAGSWQWAVKSGGQSSDFASGIVVDSNDNVFITGRFNESARFGGTDLTSSGGVEDTFIAKLSSSGSWQWTIKAGGASYVFGHGIAIAPSGNAYFYTTGWLQENTTFSDFNLIASNGGSNLFIAQLSPDSDGDYVPDRSDQCSDYDDRLDADSDGIPDGCDSIFNEAKPVEDLVKKSFTDRLSEGDLDAIGVMLAILLPIIGVSISILIKRKKISIVNYMNYDIHQAQYPEDLVKISAELESIIVNDQISLVQYQSLINKIEERGKSFNHEPLISSNVSISQETKIEAGVSEQPISIQDSVVGGDSFVGSTKIDNQIINDPEVIARAAVEAYKLGTKDANVNTIIPERLDTVERTDEKRFE